MKKPKKHCVANVGGSSHKKQTERCLHSKCTETRSRKHSIILRLPMNTLSFHTDKNRKHVAQCGQRVSAKQSDTNKHNTNKYGR